MNKICEKKLIKENKVFDVSLDQIVFRRHAASIYDFERMFHLILFVQKKSATLPVVA